MHYVTRRCRCRAWILRENVRRGSVVSPQAGILPQAQWLRVKQLHFCLTFCVRSATSRHCDWLNSDVIEEEYAVGLDSEDYVKRF